MDIMATKISVSAVYLAYIIRMSAVYQPYVSRVYTLCQPSVSRGTAVCQPHISLISAVCQTYLISQFAGCPNLFNLFLTFSIQENRHKWNELTEVLVTDEIYDWNICLTVSFSHLVSFVLFTISVSLSLIEHSLYGKWFQVTSSTKNGKN